MGSEQESHAIELLGSGRSDAGESFRLAPVVRGNSPVRCNAPLTARAMLDARDPGTTSTSVIGRREVPLAEAPERGAT